MNYPNKTDSRDFGQPRRRPPRKSNFFLLLVMGMLAFFLYSQYQKASTQARRRAAAEQSAPAGVEVLPRSGANPRAGASTDPIRKSDFVSPEIVIPDISNDGPVTAPAARTTAPAGQQAPIDNPWDRTNDWAIDTDISSGGRQSTAYGQTATESGDWVMEEGASVPSGNAGPATATKAAPPKSTTKGDWGLSEVPTKPK